MDPAIRPADDLYRHVNGQWLRDYKLPADRAAVTTFSEVSDRVQGQLREIVEGIHNPRPGSDEQQIHDLYRARMDTDTIEGLGMTPVADLFEKVDAAATKPELARVMGGLPIEGIMGLSVIVDRENSSAYLPQINQAGLGISEQYFRRPEFQQQLAQYRVFLERLASASGFPDPSLTAQRVFELERQIAAGYWDTAHTRDYDATYNLRSWRDLTAMATGFDWDPWLAGSTDRPHQLFDTVVVAEPTFVTTAAGLWREVDIATWRDYLKLSTVHTFAPFSRKEIAEANFDFTGRVINGMQQQPERWKLAIDTVDQYLGTQLGKLYVAKHFPPEAKERARQMVGDLLSAYRANFANSSWMSPPTRAASIAKLDKIDAKIGYPDHWTDYSGLNIVAGQLVQSIRAVMVFESRRAMNKLGTPVDKNEWGLSPQTVNAYYTPTANQIVFPAAFLQPPFFDKDAEPAVNFGAGGAVIGHEIGHGFDDQGRKYDGNGNRKDWWTPADLAAFAAKTAQLVAQYSSLVPAGLRPEQHVDGQLTVGENLADLRGLMIALSAFRLAEQRRGNNHPDYAPMFFAWARMWRQQLNTEAAARLVATDVHSPSEFRANQVVRNLPEFYDTFAVTPADKLFLAPDQRVQL